MRKLFGRCVLSIVLCLLLLPLAGQPAQAAEVVASCQCGWGGTWTLDSDGVMTISGDGPMHGYWEWMDYKDQIKSLVISPGVTTIDDLAFRDCTNLTGPLIIPDTVTEIGDQAFMYCSDLTGDLVIPDSVTTIGSSAFSGCSGFNGTLTISENIAVIEDYAFSGCSGLTGDLVIPDGVTEVGYCAFTDCSGFAGTLTIPDSVTKLDHGAFMRCSGLSGTLVVPDSVTEIVGSAFAGCSGFTGTLTIPRGITVISEYLFEGCTGFTGSLVIPDHITSIGTAAFYQCSGFSSDLIIPDSVQSIGDYAFYYCTGFDQNLTIGNGVTSIGDHAFFACDGFTGELTIGNSVTTIDSAAFAYCRGLTGKLTLPECLTEIGNWAFRECYGLTGDLQIPDGVAVIGEYTFYNCGGLDGKLTLPQNLTSIGDYAFQYCGNLTGGLTIPDGVTEIGDYTFYYCSGLNGRLDLPDGLLVIGASAFAGCRELIGDLIIPDTVTSVGTAAFSSCSGFTGKLVIPSGLKGISDFAFEGCSGLSGGLALPAGITTIGQSAFNNCHNLTGDLRIPNSVTTIGIAAFNDCWGFNGSLTLGHSLRTIEYNAFQECSGFTGPLVIPDSVVSIGSTAFGYCSGFTGTLVIPEHITELKAGTFYDCTGLTSVRFEGNAPLWPASWQRKCLPTGLTLYVPSDASGWTFPTWYGHQTVKYIRNTNTALGGVGSPIYIPGEVTITVSPGDPNRIRRTNINFWSWLAPVGYQEVPMEIPWGWNLLNQETGTYDNRLAIASLAMSSAIERSSTELRNLLETLDFEVYQERPDFYDFRYWEYDGFASGALTHAIARKQVEFDGEACDIFLVVCRGTDFAVVSDIADSVDPEGYNKCADLVWSHLQEYLLDYYDETDLSALKDKNMKFLFTGHSLGGAVSNLMSWKVENFASDEDVFVYTFASPLTWGEAWKKTNVFNIVNNEDIVPYISTALNGYRIGYDLRFDRRSSILYDQMNVAFLLLIDGARNRAPGLNYVLESKTLDFRWNGLTYDYEYGIDTRIGYCHDTTTYMAFLLTLSGREDIMDPDQHRELYEYGIRKASIRCPVDVEVYDSAGVLVGRVVDNAIDEDVPLGVYIDIDGDEKFVYLPGDDEYTLVLTGNDNGEMSYSVEEIDPSTGAATEKVFSSVSLTDGKAMTSEAGGSIAVPDVQLFVVNDSTPTAEVGVSGTETEIGDHIPVTTITGVPARILKGGSLTLAGTVYPSYAAQKEIVWTLTDEGTTGASLNGAVLTVPNAGTLSLTATVADGLAVGLDFAKTFSIDVIEPPALSAPSLLEWDGMMATWNFVGNASGYRVQLYKDGVASGDPITSNALSCDFTSVIGEDKTSAYTFTVIALGDGVAYSDSAASETSPVYRSTEAAIRSVNNGVATIKVNLDAAYDTVVVMVARYDDGRMTAIYCETISTSGIVTADLSAGSGTEYKAFLLDSETYSPLCSLATY